MSANHFTRSNPISSRALESVDALKLNLKNAASNLEKLGQIYSQLSGCYTEIERWNRPELKNISPKLGDLYNTLKNSVYHLSNTYSQHSSIFSKYFERTLQDVSEHSLIVVDVGSNHERESTREPR